MSQTPSKFKKHLRFSTIGLEMGLAVVLGLFVGQYLDDYLGTEPWMLLLFLLFGAAAAFRNLFRLLRELNTTQALNDKSKENDNP